MPRYVINSVVRSTKHEAFVKKLVQELTSASAGVQPLILEEEVPSTKSRHVRVIWDRWKELEDEERSAIISQAYAEAEGTEASKVVTIADGLTPQEASALGLLPFKVVPARRKSDAIPLQAYEQAMLKEARQTLLGPKAKELRYARLEDAQQAYERLQKALPYSSWAVVQELTTES